MSGYAYNGWTTGIADVEDFMALVFSALLFQIVGSCGLCLKRYSLIITVTIIFMHKNKRIEIIWEN